MHNCPATGSHIGKGCTQAGMKRAVWSSSSFLVSCRFSSAPRLSPKFGGRVGPVCRPGRAFQLPVDHCTLMPVFGDSPVSFGRRAGAHTGAVWRRSSPNFPGTAGCTFCTGLAASRRICTCPAVAHALATFGALQLPMIIFSVWEDATSGIRLSRGTCGLPADWVSSLATNLQARLRAGS